MHNLEFKLQGMNCVKKPCIHYYYAVHLQVRLICKELVPHLVDSFVSLGRASIAAVCDMAWFDLLHSIAVLPVATVTC